MMVIKNVRMDGKRNQLLTMVKVTVVVKALKAGRFNERCGNDDQCQSDKSVIMLEIPMEVPVVKVIPAISVYLMINVKVVFVMMVLVDIPIKKIWEDDPNKWRWDKNPGNLCAKEWEKKSITHNGKSYCGREGSKAGRFLFPFFST